MLLDFSHSASPDEADDFFQKFSLAFSAETKTQLSLKKINKGFLKIFGNSRFLSRFILRHPLSYQNYASSKYQKKEKTLAVFAKEIHSQTKNSHDLKTLIEKLKHYKYNEYLRLTIKELCLMDQAMIYREISNLALSVGKRLLTKLHKEFLEKFELKEKNTGDFAVISMGKLGGFELNYSSDIDLIALYFEERYHHKITNHEYFTKLFSRFSQGLQESNENGFLYRVDWDLRPEGKPGPLVNSFSALETYYQTFGEEWERQAFIKANLFFEEQKVGRNFLKLIQPFIYRKYFDLKTIENIWNIKKRIIQEDQKKTQNGFNIKLGHGGIRDIEFLIQGLQLLYGGKNPQLQNQNTLVTIEKLAKSKLIDKSQKQLLMSGYLFFRRIETALQMEEERQIQIVPNSSKELIKIARRMGFTKPNEVSLAEFQKTLNHYQEKIYKLFQEYYNG